MTTQLALNRLSIQILIFLIVFNATVNNVFWSIILLNTYSVVIIISISLMLVIAVAMADYPGSPLRETVLPKIVPSRGAAGKLISKIEGIVEIIEIVLFLQYDFFWLAIVWFSSMIFSIITNRMFDIMITEDFPDIRQDKN